MVGGWTLGVLWIAPWIVADCLQGREGRASAGRRLFWEKCKVVGTLLL